MTITTNNPVAAQGNIDEARGHFGKKKNANNKAAPSYATGGKGYEGTSSSYEPATKAAPAAPVQSPIQQTPLQAPVQQFPAATQQSPATKQAPEQYSPAAVDKDGE